MKAHRYTCCGLILSHWGDTAPLANSYIFLKHQGKSVGVGGGARSVGDIREPTQEKSQEDARGSLILFY